MPLDIPKPSATSHPHDACTTCKNAVVSQSALQLSRAKQMKQQLQVITVAIALLRFHRELALHEPPNELVSKIIRRIKVTALEIIGVMKQDHLRMPTPF